MRRKYSNSDRAADMKRLILDNLVNAVSKDQTVALVTNLDSGWQCLVFDTQLIDENGDEVKNAPYELDARKALADDRNTLVELDGIQFAIRVFGPRPKLIIVGAVHIAQILHQMASMVGYETLIVDPRSAFASADRFPDVSVRCLWPDEAFREETIGARCAFVTLSHDAKIDDPALVTALHSNAYYVGALGSRRTHAVRCERLSALGVSDVDLQRIHAPVGLDLGGRAPPEIAISILAEVIQDRYPTH
jgi:xanthine dehydrogenase accessory factor